MAILNGYRLLEASSICYMEALLDFSEDEDLVVKKWLDENRINDYNEKNKHEIKYGGNENIQNLYLNISKHKDFSSIATTVKDAAMFLIKNVYKFKLPDGCFVGISDSWITRINGCNYKDIIVNQTPMSLLTAVILLNDSQNKLIINNNMLKEFLDDFYPFNWELHEIGGVDKFETKKNKMIIFPSKREHGFSFSEDPNDTLYALVMNIWPYGNVSNTNRRSLSYYPPGFNFS